MANRKDRRTDFTINALKRSLLSLLEDTPISKISIAQLCRHADINRNTFYNHFDSPCHVLEEMENELFISFFSSIKNDHDISEVALKACECIENNKQISTLIFLQDDENWIIQKSLMIIQQFPWSLKDIEKQAGSSSDNFYRYNFGKDGTLAIIRQWIIGGFVESSTDIAKLITELLRSTLKVAL